MKEFILRFHDNTDIAKFEEIIVFFCSAHEFYGEVSDESKKLAEALLVELQWLKQENKDGVKEETRIA